MSAFYANFLEETSFNKSLSATVPAKIKQTPAGRNLV